MSQGPHDPFLASTAALAPKPAVLSYAALRPGRDALDWGVYLRSLPVIVALILAMTEMMLLWIFAPVLIVVPIVAIGAVISSRWYWQTWVVACLALAGGAAGVFCRGSVTTSIAFGYAAFFAGVIALASGGRIWSALVVAVVLSAMATFLLDVFQTQVSYPGKKVIVVAAMWATGEAKQPILEDLIKQFEAENPQYKVIVRWDGRWVLSKNRPRLLTKKDVPDMIEGAAKEELGILVKENYALPLDDYMARNSPETGKPWRDDWKPSLYELGRYQLDPEPVPGTNALAPHPLDGKLVMVSGIYYDFVYFYNKAVAHKLGITKMPQTWDEFMAVCQKAKDAGVDPIMLDTDYKDLMADTLLQASVPEAELRKTIMGGPDRKPFTDPMYVRLFDLERKITDNYLSRGWQASPYPKAQQQFAVGNGLFLLCGTWLPGELRQVAIKDKNVFDLGSMAFPRFDDEPAGTSVIQDSGWIMLKDGNERQGAIRLLQFLSDHWGKEIALKDGNPVAFAARSDPPDLADIGPQLTEMKRAVSDPITGMAPKWRQYVFLQIHEDFFMANPGDKEHISGEAFAKQLEEMTQEYIREGGEKKWD